MRKTAFILLLVFCALSIFAQETNNASSHEFTVSGEVKTGVLWERREDQLVPAKENTNPGTKEDESIRNTAPGRFRINVDYYNTDINVGFKFRLNSEDWKTASAPNWEYAFGYAKILEDQFTLSLGKLGASPWGTGGPEMWVEHEYGITSGGGIRLEYEPKQVPGLNVGFVINGFNGDREPWNNDENPIPLYEYLAESIIGASYTMPDWFHVRTAIRLDSQTDYKTRNDLRDWGNEGINLLYRIEEYALQKLVPNLKFWAMGYIYGIGANENIENKDIRNWFFLEYDPSFLTAQVRVGLDIFNERTTFYLKPSLYAKLFNNLIKVGASYEYTKYYFDGGSDFLDTLYNVMEIKPLVQLNVNENVYVAFEYSFKREYQLYYNTTYEERGIDDPHVQTQYINIRVGVTY